MLTTKLKVGAIAAAAGVIGLGVTGSATATAAPKAPAPKPAAPALPPNLQLPPEVQKFLGDLAPQSPMAPRKAYAPAKGTVTSGYGPRWGTHHHGVDIANRIGAPVRAVTDGVVLESGPASGFGIWIRVRQDDGTTGVFGHVDRSFVKAGQKVRAGQQIATVGNRGQSTGPHLHYEVWDRKGNKINPQVWLKKRNAHP